MKHPNEHVISGWIAVSAVLAALGGQLWLDWAPCEMCIWQRFALLGTGVMLIGGGKVKQMAWMGYIGLVVTALIAARQVLIPVWPLSSLCHFSLKKPQGLATLYTPVADCAYGTQSFLWLPLPAWTLITVVSIAAFLIWVKRNYSKQVKSS